MGLLYTLNYYTNIHSFAMSSNACECFFGRVKSQCLSGITENNFKLYATNEIIRKLMIGKAHIELPVNSRVNHYCRHFDGGWLK